MVSRDQSGHTEPEDADGFGDAVAAGDGLVFDYGGFQLGVKKYAFAELLEIGAST